MNTGFPADKSCEKALKVEALRDPPGSYNSGSQRTWKMNFFDEIIISAKINVLDEIVNSPSQFQLVGVVFLTIIAGSWVYDLLYSWLLKHR